MEISEALAKAEEAEIDLVEIAPAAAPPVCRLMDYGKFKYNEQKKKQDAKAKQKQIQVKEIKFRPGTDEGDYQIKLRNLIKFLTCKFLSISLMASSTLAITLSILIFFSVVYFFAWYYLLLIRLLL